MDYSKNFEKIETAGYVISVMKQALYKNYSVLVDGVISGEIRDQETIREILYGVSELMGEYSFTSLTAGFVLSFRRSIRRLRFGGYDE